MSAHLSAIGSPADKKSSKLSLSAFDSKRKVRRPRGFATRLPYLTTICEMTSAIVKIFATGRKPSMAAR
jgi:hypothetical protein